MAARTVIRAVQAMTNGKLAASLGSLPLIVIGHSPDLPSWPDDFDASWLSLGRETATASSNSVHVTATWSSHMLPNAQPGLVLAALQHLLDALRTPDHGLPSCGAALTVVGGRCD